MVRMRKGVKLDVKYTKCLFLDYCEGTKDYKLMFLWTKKIILKDDMSVENPLEMCQSGKNVGPTMVIVDKSSKSPSCDDGKEHNK